VGDGSVRVSAAVSGYGGALAAWVAGMGEGGVGELELELIQSHMARKPMLRGEVGALRCVRGKGAALRTLLQPAMPPWEWQNLRGCGGCISRGRRTDKGGGICLVVSCPGAQRAPAASGST